MAMNPKLLRPKATGFSPKNISGLAMWFDAADTATVTLNGSNVSAWSDKSGNSRNATQGTALNQPGWSATQQNGKGGILFSASTWLRTSGATFTIAQPVTVFAAFRMSTTANSSWALYDGTSARIHLYGNAATSGNMFAGSNSSSLTFGTATNFVGLFNYNGASSQVALNSKTFSSAGNPGANSLSTQWNIGANNGNASSFGGYIFELGLYTKTLSASEASALARHLGSKWGITVT